VGGWVRRHGGGDVSLREFHEWHEYSLELTNLEAVLVTACLNKYEIC